MKPTDSGAGDTGEQHVDDTDHGIGAGDAGQQEVDDTPALLSAFIQALQHTAQLASELQRRLTAPSQERRVDANINHPEPPF